MTSSNEDKTCKYCGASGLRWDFDNEERRWRLYRGMIPHKCARFSDRLPELPQ